MYIQSKFVSTCPLCNTIIAKGSRIWWEKGKQAIHDTCRKIPYSQIMEDFHKENPKRKLKFIKEENSIYYFECKNTRTGELYFIKYTTYGKQLPRETRENFKIIF